MFGLDDYITSLSDGNGVLLVCLIAVLLGLRHATDPDHVAAVATLIAAGHERAAARLGLAWGAGHATSLFVFGLPVVLFERYLPERLQQGAETLVAALIVYLALRLLRFHMRAHGDHVHPRTGVGAYGVGLAHGMGGSAGVGLLIIGAVDSRPLAVLSLVLLALFTAASMTVITTGLGSALHARPLRRLAPAFGALSLAFGLWYGAAAWAVAPYPF